MLVLVDRLVDRLVSVAQSPNVASIASRHQVPVSGTCLGHV